jgi:N-acetylneuraminic acid mutarotase
MRSHLLLTILLFFCFSACKKHAGPPHPVITGFYPNKGWAGTDVTIHGHFDSTVTQLSVSFNGNPGVIHLASDSDIIVFAPNGVTTGRITVTLNNLSSTTDSDFVVLPGAWTQVEHLPMDPNGTSARRLGIGFSIGGYGYMGLGTDGGAYFQDLYQYDPGSNAWTPKANLGFGIVGAVSMVIGNKAYIGIGDIEAADTTLFCEYDPSTDTWTRKADFPGHARGYAIALSLGGMGYVGLGLANGGVDYYDIWQYDPSLDVWTKKANFPAGGAFPLWATTFSLDNQVGYVVGGAEPDLSVAVVWRYDPASDSWTQLHNLPTTFGMIFGSAMVVNGNAYVMGGGQENWRYNATSDSWTPVASLGYRLGGSTFVINGIGYFGTGWENYYNLPGYVPDVPYPELWKFTP